MKGLEEVLGELGGRLLTLVRQRSEVTASSVFAAACMADTDWSFSLRSTTRFRDALDSDDDDEGNFGDAGAPSHFSSSSAHLRQIDLAQREDSAQYRPNPWSIARVNAATRSRQPNAAVNSVPTKPVTMEPPQGAIVDAFKRQAQKPTKSSAQANLQQVPSQNPTLTPVTSALDNLVAASARYPTSAAHITASNVNVASMQSQPPTAEQSQRRPSSSILSREAFPASNPSKTVPRPPNPHFTPNPKRATPFSSPGHLLPHPKNSSPSASRPRLAPACAPAHFSPHIFETQRPTPSIVRSVTDHLVPISSTYEENENLTHLSQPYRNPTPVKLERKSMSPYPVQNNRLPPLFRSNQPIIKPSPESKKITASSFAQARHFFEHSFPPETEIKQPESTPPREELHPRTPSPPYIQITSPPRKRSDAYAQLPPSPDSEWSTLKPPVRKANDKARSKGPEVKSGKFRLPLSLGTIRPKEPPPRKTARVVTYLPPPPPKKQKIAAEPHPRTWTSLLPSPPPSDETAPPSSPTSSVRFDSSGVSTRYKIVRAKIRQVRMPDEHLRSLVVPFDLFLCDFVLPFTPVAEGARRSTLGYPRIGQLWCRVQRP